MSILKTVGLLSLVVPKVYSVPVSSYNPISGSDFTNNYTLSNYAQDLFDTSLAWQDEFWDDDVGYLITADNTLPGRYDSRQSAWYAVGLVARNETGDIERAERIIANLYKGQYKDPSALWYGDIQQAPDEPTPQPGIYASDIYNSWDPNWRDFVGTAFMIILSDYSDRLSNSSLTTLEEMTFLLAKGDQYRVGGVDSDNLYPAYSNPFLMRCILQSFAGNYFNNANMTRSGEMWGKEIYDLFKLYDTFSEFNSPTYTGVDMFALGIWIRYAAPNSSLPIYAREMFSNLMVLTKDLYNANLKNFVGPFDRSYGYDMNQYFAITAATIWGLVGREYAPMPKNIAGMYHISDFGMAHLMALGMPQIEPLISDDVLESFKKYPGNHTLTKQAFSPPFDTYPRNISIWSDEYIQIGAETISEAKIGGPATSFDSYNPAVIHWFVREGRAGYITLRATQPIIHAVAGEGFLDVTFPNITSADENVAFTFYVSGFDVYPHDNFYSISSLPGLKLNVSGNVDLDGEIFFYDIADGNTNDFWSFNSTWPMPENYSGNPHIRFDITEYPTSTNVTYI
ncbi:hypothetical protein C6P40_003124 [Pichia californica]|uniref:Uncharacterized protein n=1 Tax=Pichia californica TaxID=460514 RepID=A0A9P6WGZ1_9ASCO|nr:hypothetical protein C6P42_003227 [[Candida] californica]KAG0686946.1 hypothetical protein C6P40_003124 [[Candida] californica]